MMRSAARHTAGRLLLALAAVAAPAPAMAAAWTQPEGGGQVINTFTYYVATNQFDEDGDAEDLRRFTKLEYSPYIEYGLTDSFTVGAQPFFQLARQNQSGDRPENLGIGDIDIFARQRVWRSERTVLSVQGLISPPGTSDANENPSLGRAQLDLEGRVLVGTALELAGVPTFYNAEAALRKRFEDPADELRLDVTAGVRPAPRWMLLVQSFNTIGLGNPSGEGEEQTSGTDFDRFKLQLSVVRALTDRLSLQVGGFREYAGRNTGLGNAGFVALWIDF